MIREPKSKRALYEQVEVLDDNNEDNSDVWDCPACTYINSIDQRICDICGTARPLRRSVGASISIYF